MTRRIAYFVAVIALVIYAGTAAAQQLSLRQISDYLDGLQTAEGAFSQINADGSLSTGRVYIKRPGRIRFEYDTPDDTLVMAGGGQVAIFDPRSNTGPDRYPLRNTPLSVILRDDVSLGSENMVTDVRTDGTSTIVTAQDPDNPQYGNIQLFFTADPLRLRQWVITDEMGGQTTVVLNDLQTGGTIRDILFNIQAEMRQRGLD